MSKLGKKSRVWGWAAILSLIVLLPAGGFIPQISQGQTDPDTSPPSPPTNFRIIIDGGSSPSGETCNGIDDDNDGQIDEGVTITYYQDADGDGFGDIGQTTQACSLPSGYVIDKTDCDDDPATGGAINPGAADVCDGVNNDCNGNTTDGSAETWIGNACDGSDTDLCEEGMYICNSGLQSCSDTTGNTVENTSTTGTCTDTIDNDCDTFTDAADAGCSAGGDPWADPTDSDGDGISNDVETLLGSDPTKDTLFIRAKKRKPGGANPNDPNSWEDGTAEFIALFPIFLSKPGFADITPLNNAGIEVIVVGANHPYQHDPGNANTYLSNYDFDPSIADINGNKLPCDILELELHRETSDISTGHKNIGHTLFDYTNASAPFWTPDVLGATTSTPNSYGYRIPKLYRYVVEKYLSEGAYASIAALQDPDTTDPISPCINKNLTQLKTLGCFDFSNLSPMMRNDPGVSVETDTNVIFTTTAQITSVGSLGTSYTKADVKRRTIIHEIGHAMLPYVGGEDEHCTETSCIMNGKVSTWVLDDFGAGGCIHTNGGLKDIRNKVHNNTH